MFTNQQKPRQTQAQSCEDAPHEAHHARPHAKSPCRHNAKTELQPLICGGTIAHNGVGQPKGMVHGGLSRDRQIES